MKFTAKTQEPQKHIQTKALLFQFFMEFVIQPATPQCCLPGDSNETSGFAHAKSTTKDH